jgi:hypothetical protein
MRRYNLERSREMAMTMLGHLAKGINGRLIGTAQDSVDKLKDPFLTMNRMQRELRRIIAQEERLDPEEGRRADRRDDLDRSMQMTTEMIELLAKGLSGLLHSAPHDCVQKLNDPFLAMTRMQRELRRIIALAEQLDEDDAARAVRLAAEAEAEEDAERHAEMQRAWAIEAEKEEARKAAIHQAVSDAAYEAWGEDDPNPDCEGVDCDDDDCESVRHLLDDLFDDYDTYESYDGDSVAIVAKMCAELGLTPHRDPSDEPDPDDDDPEVAETEAETQARALEIARGYLEQAELALANADEPPDG